VCPRHLRVFIAWIETPHTDLFREELEAIRDGDVDPRLVHGCIAEAHSVDNWRHPYTVVSSYPSFLDDDKYSALSDYRDFWALAEDIVEERRRKKLEVRHFTLFA
jgi:hypothetical protein